MQMGLQAQVLGWWEFGKVQRLVAKGFTQVEDINYTEAFSPIAKSVTIKLIIALVAMKHWHLIQLDVTNAFLRGELLKEVYMSLPQGYSNKGDLSRLVCKLHKSL